MMRTAAALSSLMLVASACAEEPIRLQERFTPGYQYRVNSRVRLSGELTIPPDQEYPKEQKLAISGESAIDYDERVLEVGADGPAKTLRIYKRIDFQKKIGKLDQDNSLRPAARRLVVIRRQHNEVPFSPDGPLLYNEIDMVRTDVFTPALAGLLPADRVRPGGRWQATAAAVTELTDLEKIESGTIDCRFEEIVTIAGRKQARIALNGTVRGVNEDGPSRYEISGFLYFDLASNHLSYLSFRGKHLLLDKDGKTNGWNEGTFTLTRQANVRSADLSDTAIRGVVLEPNADNTLLLYDNPDIGLKFLYPRRWRVGSIQGRQLMIDDNENRGNGILLTLEELKSTPAPEQFQKEIETFLKEQKGRILGVQSPRQLQSAPYSVHQFAVEAEMAGQKLLLDYYVLRQAQAGATIAARVLPSDIRTLRPEIERIAKSIVFTRAPNTSGK